MPDQVEDLIRAEAKRLGIPAALALGVAEHESGPRFNPTALGPEITVGGQQVRAIGTFQLLPSTAEMLGIDANDPRQNITGGITYLRQLMDRHQGDLDAVLREYGGVVDDTEYVPGVLARVQRFQQAGAPATAPPLSTIAGTTPPSTAEGDPIGVRPGGIIPGAGPGILRMGARALAQPFNPMTPTGRVNWAATIAAITAGYFTGGLGSTPARLATRPFLAWVARVFSPPAAAAAAGGGERGI